MTDSAANSQRDPLDLLIEQFLTLYRSGEPVTVAAFAEQHAEHSEQLLELLPTLLALEDVKRDRASSGSGAARVSLPKLERLGDFRIEGELGRGGMGVVFEAVQESLDRRVALKVLPQASLLTGNQLKRFRREAQIAARLHHTNIVPVYGSGESDGYHWYAMQYLNGQSLDQWRQTQSEMLPEGSGAWRNRARFVARIGVAAASALHYAHGMGTLHRDIKPGNFMLDRDEHLWMTDFGLAKALEAEGLTQSGDLVGTLQYMAPEQFAGNYDVRSEVYALGVTLYEMLTLGPAFRGRHRSELMEHVKSQRIELLQRVCPDVPLELTIIIGKAMAREPRDRYQDAQALEQDLEAFLEDRPIQARPLSTLATMWRWCRRNRTAASLVASTAAGVLLAAIIGWVAYGVTGDALRKVTESEALANRERERAESNLGDSLVRIGHVFDALIGRDPALSFDEDPDTGEETVVVHSAMSEGDIVLLRLLLGFYDQFASKNVESQSLRYETARAYRRAGAIHSRLGEPESLLEAETAYAKALSGFLSITDRDVTRDLVTLHVDIGHLRVRQYQPQKAGESFREALALLEKLPNSDAPKIRLERAEVLFELSRSSGSGRGGGGRGRRPREELRQAEQLLQDLAQATPEDPKVRALQARVLMENVRRLDQSDDVEKAITILRDLVVAYPNVSEYRFQLCEALLGRRPSSRERSEAERTARLAVLQEADESAESLFRAQPLFREGRVLLLRVRSRYGFELYRSARSLSGSEQAERSKLAKEKLLSAAEVGRALVAGEEAADFRLVRHVTEALCCLGIYYESHGQKDEAKAQAIAAIDLGERSVLASLARRRDLGEPGAGLLADGGAPEGPGPDGARGERGRPAPGRSRGDWPPRSGELRRGPPGEGRRAGPRGAGLPGDNRRSMLSGPLAELVQRLHDDDINARCEEALAHIKEAFAKARTPR